MLYGMDESAFDNALVAQKNAILALVNDGKHREALAALNVVREMWIACRYDYKVREIAVRIARELDAKLGS